MEIIFALLEFLLYILIAVFYIALLLLPFAILILILRYAFRKRNNNYHY